MQIKSTLVQVYNLFRCEPQKDKSTVRSSLSTCSFTSYTCARRLLQQDKLRRPSDYLIKPVTFTLGHFYNLWVNAIRATWRPSMDFLFGPRALINIQRGVLTFTYRFLAWFRIPRMLREFITAQHLSKVANWPSRVEFNYDVTAGVPALARSLAALH